MDIQKAKNELTQQDWKDILNGMGGYTGMDLRPLDQFEWQILQAINSGKKFVVNTKYDVKVIGKGFKNGSIELLRDTSLSKLFVGSFHVNRQDGTDKLANITIYKYESSLNKESNVKQWQFIEKIIIDNKSDNGYPVLKLLNYIQKQLEIDGQEIKNRYSKVVEGETPTELESFASLIDIIKDIDDIDKSVVILKQIFENNKKKELTKYLIDNDLLSEDIRTVVDIKLKISSIKEYIGMLNSEHSENDWQKWFGINSWLFGTEFVKVIDDRRVDVENITDYLVEAYDGFLDIIEIKKPSSDIKFWSETKDHNNYFPHSDLIKAITQSINYISQIEKQIDSKEFQKRVNNISVIKPRCTLIFGRSFNWNDEQKEAYRILNSSYHNITILTYDHVLERAKRMLSPEIEWPTLVIN